MKSFIKQHLKYIHKSLDNNYKSKKKIYIDDNNTLQPKSEIIKHVMFDQEKDEPFIVTISFQNFFFRIFTFSLEFSYSYNTQI